MRRELTAVAFVCILVAAGCATPQPADLEYATSARSDVVALLDGWTEAIRNKDVAAAMALADPKMGFAARARLEHKLTQVIWLARYAGYRIDGERAASSLSWRVLKEGKARVRALCTNRDGDHFEERYTVVRRGEDWFVASVELARRTGAERADLPEEEVEKIRREIRFVIDSLKAGRPGKVYAMLPDDEAAHYRTVERYSFARIFGGAPDQYSIYEDLQIMKEFEIAEWPDPDGELPLYFLAPTIIEARFDIPYTWAEGGIYRQDILWMRILVVRNGGTWRLHMIRLYGQGIENSL